MSGNWLLVETSGKVGRVGLARGDAVVRAAELDETRRHARDLAGVVGDLLAGEGLRPADLTGVMVGIGPGSYTGLRVGIISAKALAYATGCNLVAVPTFAAIAVRASGEAKGVWVIADALQGLLYRQRFGAAADGLRIEPADEWLKSLSAGEWVSGPGVKLVAGRIPTSCSLVPEADREPSVESLFAAGRSLLPLTRAEVFRLEPLYLRGSSAEEKAKTADARPGGGSGNCPGGATDR
jgi:tRNA threonylcarbamoyladenosine biosynthesis protein TsaB